ncbi:MAG: SDR family oxidoreductase [Verrucomicrobia bacterium]|nr:SDR family oxidoreductase [Verrucomicrobiota bacterium]
MNLQLTGKPVIVCASSAGLGKAAALEFAREGANVMLAARRQVELQKAVAEIKAATGREAQFTVTDMTKADDIARLVESTVAAFGGVFTLVNNSGGPPAGTFDQFDDAAWQRAFELNLLSYVRAIRAVLPHMRKGGGGRIVNYTSSSVKSPLDNLILSNTFRMGVLGLAKTLAGELGKDGILVNVLGPGRIQTDRIEQLDSFRAEKTGATTEQVRAENFKSIPLGRYGVPEEFAKLTVFLGSPANSYITGQTILVEGGMVKAY